jgi:F0F1-type ATP synthase assembly protein I
VAETGKLSVGQVLEKLRGTDAPKAKMARLDEKIDTLDEETQRLRAMRRRLERDQRAGSTERDAQEVNTRRVSKLKILGIIVGIVIGIVIVISILARKWGLL